MSQDHLKHAETIADNPAALAVSRPFLRGAVTMRTIAGAFLGFAWGAALRGWMVLLALNFGERPQFTWQGTIAGILLPATVLGALLGRVNSADEVSGRKRWWVIFSPFLLVSGPAIFTKDFFTILFTTGMGGGAIGVALIGMLGAYALSGPRAPWKRWTSGIVAGILTIASGCGPFLVEQNKPTIPLAVKVFGMFLFVLLMGLFIAGIHTPFRRRSKSPVSHDGFKLP